MSEKDLRTYAHRAFYREMLLKAALGKLFSGVPALEDEAREQLALFKQSMDTTNYPKVLLDLLSPEELKKI